MPGRLKKGNILLSLLFIIALGLRLYFVSLSPFLHNCDERFHALVSRNLMHHPFRPMLKMSTLAHYDPYLWCCNHIWLHKQPLFMWQMALSMKIFGVSELSLRLPSVIMGALMILLLYRISFLFTRNTVSALLTATLLCFSHFHIDLITGIHGMDHNDVAFGFYVLASVWTYMEYRRSGKWHWIMWVGIFAGCAVLNKWLLGLTVYLGWDTHIVYDFLIRDRKKLPKELLQFLLSLVVCIAAFLPWRLHILHRWPAEANYVYAFNLRHITEALEGHTGSAWYYLGHFPDLFGYCTWLFLLPGVVITFRKAYKKKDIIYYLTLILFVFCFFSFVVQTKVDTYFFFVVPFCLMFVAIGVCDLAGRLRRKRTPALVGMALSLVYSSLRPEKFAHDYSSTNPERNKKIYNTRIYKNIKAYIPAHVKTVINVNSFEDVELMFYHNDITAYHWSLPEEDLKKFEAGKIPVAAFKNHGDYKLPGYILNYPYLYIIDKELR